MAFTQQLNPLLRSSSTTTTMNTAVHFMRFILYI